jgi:Bacterial Ig domain
MTSKHRSFCFRPACVAALSVILGLVWILPFAAWAQGFGSLVVKMTSPTSGAALRGTITVAADVTTIGGLAVMGVQFKLDGANLGPEDTTAPYSIPWNTTTASNASHTLRAVARDFLGVQYTSNAVTVTVDNVRPTVTINQSTGQADPTNSSPINFTVAFSEVVTGFSPADVTVAGTAGGTKTVTVTGGPSAYNVAISGMTSGTVIATIAAGIAVDAVGNSNTASTSTDNTVTFGATVPTVTINQATGQMDPAGTSPINFTAIFSQAVSGFTSADVAIAGTAGGTKTVTVTGGPSTYNVAISGMTDGTVIATIPAGVVHNAAGTGNAASTSTDNRITFDLSVPTVAITSPADGATVGGVVPVTASASDNTGVAGVQFRLDGVNLGAEDTTAPYEVSWNTSTTVNGLHTLTAVARDAGGLQGASTPVDVTVSNGSQTQTRFEETDRATSYTSGWAHYVGDRPFSGGTAAFSPKTDGRATFEFVGTSVRWIGFRGPQTGIALVFLDGIAVAQIDTYSPTEEVKAVIYSAEGLQSGSHTLLIEVTGLKNPASSDFVVVVDSFDVGPALPPPMFTSGKRVEETGPSVGYTSGWTQGNRMTAWSGGTAAVSTTPGARATFAFTGTSVKWIGFRGPAAGIARVFLDGALVATVDLYEPFALQAVAFSTSNLAHTSHTMVVESTGLRNSASTGALVAVDAFDTRARFEEDRPAIAYQQYWELTVSRAWSDRTAVFTWVAGAQAAFTFNGSSVRWIGFRGPIAGIARVYLDGNLVGTVDAYAADEEAQTVLYEASGLAPGSHTLTIVVTGEMNPLSTNPFIGVDAFDINF